MSLRRLNHRRSPSRLILGLLSRFSSSSSSPLPPLSSFLSPPNSPLSFISPPPAPPPPSSSCEIASAFRDWFLSAAASPPSLLDEIYSALAAASDSYESLDAALARLRIPLSETFVLSALRHRPKLLPLLVTSDVDDPMLVIRLRFFDWSSHKPPYRHTRAVYHAVFRLLVRSRRAYAVLDWLRMFSAPPDDLLSSSTVSAPPLLPSARSSLIANTRFHDMLIIGYAVAGKPEYALRLFGRMRYQGLDLQPFAFHVLVNSLVDASLHELADSLYFYLATRRRPDDPPDLVATFIRIKSLCLRGHVDEAESLLRSLPSVPASQCAPAAGVIVEAFCKCRKHDEAFRIVCDFPSRDVYNIWVRQLIAAGRIDATLEFLAAKKSLKYIPEDAEYARLMYQLLQKGLLGEVYDIIIGMMEEGICPSHSTMNAVLCFFCKAGFVEVACHLFNTQAEMGIGPNHLVCNELIHALCQEGDTDQAYKVLEESMKHGQFPGLLVFSRFIDKLCHEGKLEKVRELLEKALERQVRPWAVVLARYIAALCKGGKVEEAFSLMHKSLVADKMGIFHFKKTYTNLIRSLIHLGKVDVLPNLIIEMQNMGHTPSLGLYRTVVCTLCEMGKSNAVIELLQEQLKRKELEPPQCFRYFLAGVTAANMPDMAQELYMRMEKAGFETPRDCKILLLLSYIKSKRIGDALSFFNSLQLTKIPSKKLYNVFIAGLCKADKPEQAVAIWRDARAKGILPSLECYEELILHMSIRRCYSTVVEVLHDFIKTERPLSSFLCNMLLLHSLKGTLLWRAWLRSIDENQEQELLEANGEFQDRRSVKLLVDGLIDSFSRGVRLSRNPDQLLSVAREIEKYCQTDTYTYNMLLRAFSMIGRMDMATDLFNMFHKKGHQPNRWSFDIMLHGFCKIGDERQCNYWMKAMSRNGFSPTWYTMRLYNCMKNDILYFYR